MSGNREALLKKAKQELELNEHIPITSKIPKFEGNLVHYFNQYGIVDQEMQTVTTLPSFVRSMEDVTRFIRAAEQIHDEAIEAYKLSNKKD